VGRHRSRSAGVSQDGSAEDLRALLDGRHPATGRSLIITRRPDRLLGLDLMFSAPKSVSLLFALSEEATLLAIRRAHDMAVAQALGYLEREASEVRRGKDGIDRLPGHGLVAATFRHRTSPTVRRPPVGVRVRVPHGRRRDRWSDPRPVRDPAPNVIQI
jgi:conjugative relaxase-like TrwC/TraI family protein